MVKCCCVFGCPNKFSKDSGIHFFKFPLKNSTLLKKWLFAVRRKNFIPNEHTFICSVHFEKEDFKCSPGAYRKMLKEDAVPSVFPSFPEYYKKKPKKARTTKSSLGGRTTNSHSVPSTSTCVSNVPVDKGNLDIGHVGIVDIGLDLKVEQAGQLKVELGKELVEKSVQTDSVLSVDKKVQTEISLSIDVIQGYRKKLKILNQKVRRNNIQVQKLKYLLKQLTSEF